MVKGKYIFLYFPFLVTTCCASASSACNAVKASSLEAQVSNLKQKVLSLESTIVTLEQQTKDVMAASIKSGSWMIGMPGEANTIVRITAERAKQTTMLRAAKEELKKLEGQTLEDLFPQDQ